MGVFSNTNPRPFEGMDADQLDERAKHWGEIARLSAARGDDLSAKYAREARAAALAKGRGQHP